MKSTLFCLFSLALAQVALAQNVPVLKYGQCPVRTSAQGNACVPVQGTQVFWNGGATCPVGWTRSGQYCER